MNSLRKYRSIPGFYAGLAVLMLMVLPSNAPAQTTALPHLGHVIIVFGENSSYSSTYNSGSMPYLDSLAAQYSLATNYVADTHPSIGNYLVWASGDILTNDDGYSSTFSNDNIANDVERAGMTWKDYVEDIDSNCPGLNSGGYAAKHDPLVFFTNINQSNRVCFDQFATDLQNHALPNLSYLAPNLCDDAHDCSLDTFDNWLQVVIAPLLASSYFQPGGDGLLVITFDEGSGSTSNSTNGIESGTWTGGQVETVVISPMVKLGYQSSNSYHHESILRLFEGVLGLTAFPGASANPNGALTAPIDMADFFSPATTANVTLAPTSVTLNAIVGSSSSQAFTVKNGGTSSVGISSVTLTPGTLGGEFTQSNNCSTLSASGGTCTVTVTFAPTSTGTATATLSVVDAASATALTASLTGLNSDFALTTPTSSPGETITAGQTATYTLNVSPEGGFNQSVSLACSGAPPASTCTISPSSVTLDGSTTATATVSVATTARSGGLPNPTAPPASHPGLPLLVLWLAVLSAGLAAIRKYPRRRAQAAATLLAATLFLVMVWAGCGGGSTNVSRNHSGTPAGDYSLTVTASAASGSTTIQHTSTLPLKVN